MGNRWERMRREGGEKGKDEKGGERENRGIEGIEEKKK